MKPTAAQDCEIICWAGCEERTVPNQPLPLRTVIRYRITYYIQALKLKQYLLWYE